jgi:hypothetical protein
MDANFGAQSSSPRLRTCSGVWILGRQIPVTAGPMTACTSSASSRAAALTLIHSSGWSPSRWVANQAAMGGHEPAMPDSMAEAAGREPDPQAGPMRRRPARSFSESKRRLDLSARSKAVTAGTSAVCLAALPTASTAATVSAVAECAGTCSAYRRRPNDAGASAHADDEHLQLRVKHRVPGAAGGDDWTATWAPVPIRPARSRSTAGVPAALD